MRLYHLVLTFVLLILSTLTYAQDSVAQNPDMASSLRSSGKIYVVVLVLATIFAGIIAFLIYLERRLSRMERHPENSQ